MDPSDSEGSLSEGVGERREPGEIDLFFSSIEKMYRDIVFSTCCLGLDSVGTDGLQKFNIGRFTGKVTAS